MAWPWVHEMVERLSAAVNGEKAQVIASYSHLTGKSPAQLYRIAKRAGYCAGRKPRKDKGQAKSGVTKEQVTYVAALVEKTGRENKGGILPVEAAMEIAFDEDILDRGQVSVSTMQRLLRQYQMDKERMKDPTPHTPLRSLHPNHVHAVDSSVCIQYYLKKGGLAVMDERDFYKNKPDAFAKIKEKLIRVVLADHFSGAFYFHYYVAGGETGADLWDFLQRAWRPKADPRLPFHGVPKLLLADGGSPVRSTRALRTAIQRLGVEIPQGRPYNPRRQGGAESAHNQIEEWFETKLRIQPAHSVEDLNAWKEDFLVWHQATRIHTRHGMTRTACWLSIRPEEHLRELPDGEVLEVLCEAPQECTVMNNRIRYRGAEFNVKHLPGIHQRAKVVAHVNPYRWQRERVIDVAWNDARYEVAAIERLEPLQGGFEAGAAIIGQEYKAQPLTASQRAKEEIEQIAGTAGKKGVPFAGTRVFGHYADKVPANVVPIPRAGTPLEVGREIVAKRVPIIELFKRIRLAGVTIEPALNAGLREAFGESVEVGVADAVAAAIAEGRDWRAACGEARREAL